MPEVAIVIPAYNRVDQLRSAIESVFAQSFQSYELIVVDDASTYNLDATQDSVESSGHWWKRLEMNRGPAAARNEGVQLSSSKWISFLDSDDEWAAEKIAEQWQWHQDNPEFSISQVNEAWYRNGVPFSKPKHLKQASGDLFDVSCRRCAIGPSCVMMTRKLWDQCGGFDERFRVCEDYALWLHISSKESVGLVSGPPLVKKHGGHSDQLSVETPLMERYRFLALLEWLQAYPGGGVKQMTVWESLRFFGDQLEQYGNKHRHLGWASFFEEFDFSACIDETVMKKAWSIFHEDWSGTT